jgi:tetratricopeptide (TPR) repeat protein
MRSPDAPPSTISNDHNCIGQSLSLIIKTEGVSILDDPKRVRSLLADHCSGENKREIVLLTHLLEEQVHRDLIRDKDSIPYNLLSANITQRILANHPFDIHLVQWGIDTISVALGIIQNVPRNQPISKTPQNPSSNIFIPGSHQNNDDLISQAICFNQTNLFHEALDLLNKVIENYPNNPLALREKGFALSNLGNYEESLHWYDLSLGINPNDTLTWTYKGYALSKIGRMRDAVQMYERAIRLDSNNAIAWRSKGYSLVKLHEEHSAMMCYQKSLEINPDDPITWNLIGWVKRDWNEKLRAFDRALSLDPGYIAAMINKGWVLSKFGRFQDALTTYERVLVIEKNNQKAWKERGYCLRKIHEQKKYSYPPTHSPSQTYPIPTQKNRGIIDRIKGFFK